MATRGGFMGAGAGISACPRVCLTSIVYLAMGFASVTAQQVVSGIVVDASGRRPLSRVRVTHVGVQGSVITDSNGRFSMAGMTESSVILRLERDGYVTEMHDVQVSASSPPVVVLAMTPLAAAIAELRVIALPGGPAPPFAGGGSHLRYVDPASTSRQGSVADFLKDRSTGLGFERKPTGGGGTTTMRIRGSSSMMSNEPLVFVDGVRLSGLEILDELPLAHVSLIEIIRGPDARNYGFGAGHGVVMISTRARATRR